MITKFKNLNIKINRSKKTAFVSMKYKVWDSYYTMTKEEINNCWQWTENDWSNWINAKDNNLL